MHTELELAFGKSTSFNNVKFYPSQEFLQIRRFNIFLPSITVIIFLYADLGDFYVR